MSKIQTAGFWRDGLLWKQREGLDLNFEQQILKERAAHYRKVQQRYGVGTGVLQQPANLSPRLRKRH